MEIDPEVIGRDVIVIGASAGGVQALRTLVEDLPPDLKAAVFVVLHVSPEGHSALPAILSRSGPLPAIHPAEGEVIRRGHIYVAPPDRHLAIRDGYIHLSRNASENGHRPAVDVLFRTAALTYGPRVVGVVLTGNLDDGTAGLAAIKRCGGVAVAQDPREADYPGMPQSAIANVEVDHVVPVADIGLLLRRLLDEPRPVEGGCGEVEMEPDQMGVARDPELTRDAEPSGLTCPDCGGSLFEKPGEQPMHFRCRTGHAYSPESLLIRQSSTTEETLWAALRALEENASLARRMERRARAKGNALIGERYEQRALEADKHAAVLRTMLQQGGMSFQEVAGDEKQVDQGAKQVDQEAGMEIEERSG